MFHRIRYCVFSCPRTIYNSVIQSDYTVIVLLFCYLPVIILDTSILLCYSAILPVLCYLPVFCSSAIPLIAVSASVLLGANPIPYWYLFIIHLLLKIDIAFIYSTVHNV